MTEISLTDRLAEGRRDAVTAMEEGWTDHPVFKGVRMKPLVTGAASGGTFSTLMVRLDAGAEMRPHRHDGQTEQHLVLEGDGRMTLEGAEVAYAPGALTVIPRAAEHSVTAGGRGMVLMAVFSPPIN